jgi:hypothetical protein
MVQRTRQESESRPESSPDSAICRMSPESQVGSDTKNVSDTQMVNLLFLVHATI